MKRFQKPSKELKKWTAAQTQERMALIKSEISVLSKSLNDADSRINELQQQKRTSSFKIGNKQVYLNQLEAQLKEILDNEKVELYCQECGEKFIGSAPQTCCSGSGCGCMGQPVDPIVCSDECYYKLINKYNKNEQDSL